MIHILHSYFKPGGVGTSKWQDKPLPDPNAYGLLFSTIPAAAIMMHTLDPVNKSRVVNVTDHEVPM